MALQHFKGNHDRWIPNTLPALYSVQYVHMDRPPIKTRAADGMATESFSKFMSPNIGPFRITDVSQNTVRID